MRIHNVHERRVDLPPHEIAALLDALGTREDRLWPRDRWPAMRLEGGLQPGATGGHGPIRYDVAAHVPGRLAAFRFRPEMGGLEGEHRFEVDGTLLRHVLTGTARGRWRILWPLVFEPLHDSVVEDAFDRAQGRPPRPLSLRVRLLRAAARRLAGG